MTSSFYSGYCYEIVAGNMKYADAQEACKKTCGGVIGYPSDESDLGFFASIGLNAGTWLGATDVATEAAWVTPDKTYYQGFVVFDPIGVLKRTGL